MYPSRIIIDCFSEKGGNPFLGEVHQIVLDFITSYWTVVCLTTTPRLQHQMKCCLDWADLRMFVVGRYRDGLSVARILLDPPSALEVLDHIS